MACNGNQAKQEKADSQIIDSMAVASYVIDVEGMSCGGCENTIQKAIMELPGAVSVDADHASGKVMVKYDTTKIEVALLKETIDSKGYHSGNCKKAL